MAASCCGQAGHLRGRYQPVPAGAGLQVWPCATITARAMSSRRQNRRVHVPDHQLLAVLTVLAVLAVLARCRLAAHAGSPGAGRIQDHAEGLAVPAGFSAYLPAGLGVIGRVIGVPAGSARLAGG